MYWTNTCWQLGCWNCFLQCEKSANSIKLGQGFTTVPRYKLKKLYIKKIYIIGHYNPLVSIIDLASHTTYVMCVNFIHEWRDLQFPNGRFFWESFHCNFIFTLRVFARNLLRGNHWRNTSHILFWCLACGSNPYFMSNKPTHYLLDHGVFTSYI